MQINFSTESADLPLHKCLALGIFSDERPPRGIGGLLDWRLNGFISREIKQGRISGEFQEKVVIPFPGRIGSEILLLFGLGTLNDVNYDRIYTAAYQTVSTVADMQLNNFAVDLPGEGRSATLNAAGIVETMVTGFFDCLSKDIERLSNMTSCFVTTSDKVKEIATGIQRFKSNVHDMGSVDAGVLENSFD